MTVSTTSSSIVVAATGANSYSFPFIAVAASDISVSYTTTSGTQTTLPPTAYTVSINAPLAGSIWGVGGTVSPTTPASYSTGSLTISRVLPFTQTAEVSNQGNQYPIVTEQALDTLCMQLQQIAARTGQYRGSWATGVGYNYGDMVQDGINGAFTNNIYLCVQANTSGSWAADLASGYWELVISVATLQPPGSFLPLTGGTVNGNLAVTGTTSLGVVSASGTLQVTGHTTLEGVTSTGATGVGKIVYSSSPTIASPTFTGVPLAPTPSAGTSTAQLITAAYTLGGVLNNVQVFIVSGTYTITPGTSKAIILNQGAGGGGAGSGSSGGGTGGTGGTTSVGSLCSATGGAGGTFAASANGTVGGAGGVGSLGILNLPGSAGGATIGSGSSTVYGNAGGAGGVSFFGGAALQSAFATNGNNAGANTGSGGSGASAASGSTYPGAGGGAGGLSIAYVANASNQTVTIGAGGTAGAAGTSGSVGGAGASGVVVILEYK